MLRASSLAARSSTGPVPVGEAGVGEVRGDLGTGFPPGRLVELCAAPDAAQTSTAARVLREAQAQGDPVAWVVPRADPSSSAPNRAGAGLYPPDLAAAGLDLDALLVVHVAPSAIARAAELVLRTGAFGAVVLDLSGEDAPRGNAWQGRLLGLAREHACRVIVLSPNARARASLGPLVSLRFDVRRTRVADGRFRVDAVIVKDKLGAATEQSAPFAGPVGAR